MRPWVPRMFWLIRRASPLRGSLAMMGQGPLIFFCLLFASLIIFCLLLSSLIFFSLLVLLFASSLFSSVLTFPFGPCRSEGDDESAGSDEFGEVELSALASSQVRRKKRKEKSYLSILTPSFPSFPFNRPTSRPRSLQNPPGFCTENPAFPSTTTNFKSKAPCKSKAWQPSWRRRSLPGHSGQAPSPTKLMTWPSSPPIP